MRGVLGVASVLKVVSDMVAEGAAEMSPAGVDDKSGTLVDNQDVIVFEYDGKLPLFRFEIPFATVIEKG